MKYIIEQAYRNFRYNVACLCIMAEYLKHAAAQLLVWVTLPIWIIPYHFWRRRKHESNES